MPLNARDILLVVRAKDEASNVLRGVGRTFGTIDANARASAAGMMAAGSALLTFGAGLTGVGIGLGNMVLDWADAAVEYERQVALTLTQTDNLHTSIGELAEIGRQVALDIPVPFEEIQTGLYDIFSSLDVGVADAELILRAFSKGAVAGQTSLEASGRSTIAVLNAFGLGAEDVNRIMDVQFQLVRKGVGTYEEFASTLGLALPAATRSGQSFETMAGMLAFMTRNGLSASRAATSSARAMENLAKPAVIARMKELGVSVTDGEGNFRQMNDIVLDLADAFDGLNPEERAKALDDLFKGSGNNIQARRFWDLAIENADEFNQRALEMTDSVGALDEAFAIMEDTDFSSIQRFNNALDVSKTLLGDEIRPVLREVRDYVTDLLESFAEADPEVHRFVAALTAIAAIASTVIGALAGISGVILLIGGAIRMMGGLGAIIALGAPMMLVIAGLAGAAYLIYKNWDKIMDWWEDFWPDFKAQMQPHVDWVKKTWAELWPEIQRIAQEAWEWIRQTWSQLWPQIQEQARQTWDWLKQTWAELWPEIQRIASIVWDWLVENWPLIWEAIQQAWQTGKEVFENVVEVIGDVLAFMVEEVFPWFVDTFGPGFISLWEGIRDHLIPVIQGFIDLFDLIIEAIKPFVPFFKEQFDLLTNILGTAFGIFGALVETFLGVLQGVLDFIVGVFTGDWSRAWDGIKTIFSSIWDGLVTIVNEAWDGITGGVKFIWDTVVLFFGFMKAAVIEIWNQLFEWIKGVPGMILGAIGDLSMLLWDVGKSIVQGLWDGMKDKWNDFTGWLDGLGDIIKLRKGPPSVDAKLLTNNGQLIMQGLQRGMSAEWREIEGWLSSLDPNTAMSLTANGNLGTNIGSGFTPLTGPGSTGQSIVISEGAVKITVEGNADEEKIQRAVQQGLREVVQTWRTQGVQVL